MTRPQALDSLIRLLGPAHVLTDPQDMMPYLREERGLYQGQALAVLRPADTAQMAETVKICAAHRIPMVPQGGNTGLCGGAVPFAGWVVLSTERLNRIRRLDPVGMSMDVEAGCILKNIQDAAQAADCLFPLSLAAEGSCRIGGNLSTNAGGVNVLRFGNARDLVLGLEVVLPDGQIWNGLSGLRKDNTGYDLKHLFMGAEGTLGIITAASLKLFPKPKFRETALIAVADPAQALAVLTLVRAGNGESLTACELIPRIGLDMAKTHIPGISDPFDRPHPWYLLLETCSGLPCPMDQSLAAALDQGLAQDAVIAQSQAQRAALWHIRESIPEAQKREGGSIKHDVSVRPSDVPHLLERGQKAVTQAMPGVRVVAFGHLGDGNIHFNLSQPVDSDKAAFLECWKSMNALIHHTVIDLGGSISAEHGIGLLKKDELSLVKDKTALDIMQRIKKALDPLDLMNPGKVLP